jgi:hypothetical protein
LRQAGNQAFRILGRTEHRRERNLRLLGLDREPDPPIGGSRHRKPGRQPARNRNE